MPYVVGLTGGIGSGKSAVGEMFARRGIVVVDADAIAHELTTPGGAGMPSIRDAFGPAAGGVLGEIGVLLRGGLNFLLPLGLGFLIRVDHLAIGAGDDPVLLVIEKL